MNRRGFALVAVLWLLAVAGVMAAATMVAARDGMEEAVNRLALMRGRWAGEGCEAVFRARFASDGRTAKLDTVDLGGGAWCVATLDDPASRINVNLARAPVLRRIFGSDSVVDAVLDWLDSDSTARPLGAEESWYREQSRAIPRNGPLASVEELRLVRGVEEASLPRLRQVLAVGTNVHLNLNVASTKALDALGIFDPVTILHIRTLRTQGRLFDSFNDLLAVVDASSRARLGAQETELKQEIGFSSDRLFLLIAGGVKGFRAVWHTAVEVGPTGRRLAVISRRIE